MTDSQTGVKANFMANVDPYSKMYLNWIMFIWCEEHTIFS
jgi:hypothetical protein